MEKQDLKIHIIGAGVSGLVAALVLEAHGFSPVILEATDRVGGRVKTTLMDGYQLDHGFQVLLTEYPTAKKYLDYDALALQPFLPGTSIFKNGTAKIIGDPLRKLSLLAPTVFSGIGSFSDKIKILELSLLVNRMSIQEIFRKEEKTTYQYLLDFGFSENIITQFFRPFFSGIFLETDLYTSSRMFEFVYKMFAKGLATIPKDGIEAIPKQLKAKLTKTTFHFNSPVANVKESSITLKDNTSLESDFTIIATTPGNLIPGFKKGDIQWKSCDTLYFETSHKVIKKALIGLIADTDTLINNIVYPTQLKTNSKGAKELLSVTVVKEHSLSVESLTKQVQTELERHCGINDCKFLAHFYIPNALPALRDIHYDISPSETKLTSSLFLAGDTVLNGSLNAAMIAGERAALAVIESKK